MVSDPILITTGTSVIATQNIPNGVTLAQASTSAFQVPFVAVIANTCGVSTTAITGLTVSQGRRLRQEGRHLLSGVNVQYSVMTGGIIPISAPVGGGSGGSGTTSSSRLEHPLLDVL